MVGNKPTSTQLSRASAAANDQQWAKEIPKIPYSGHFTAGNEAFARDSDSSNSTVYLDRRNKLKQIAKRQSTEGGKGSRQVPGRTGALERSWLFLSAAAPQPRMLGPF